MAERNKAGYLRHPLESNYAEGVLDVDHIQPDIGSLAGTPRNSNTSGGTSRNSNTSVHSPSPPVPPYNRHNQALPPPVVPSMGTKRPESLAVKGHEYEELPGQKYLNTQYTYPESEGYVGQPTPPRSVKFGGSKENLCHSGSNGSMMSDRPPPPVYRKRHNPLYEEEKDAMVPKKSKAQSGLCQCPCLTMLIFCVLSLVTFILVILLIAGVVSTSDSNSDGYPRTGASTGDNNYSVEYMQLEAKYQELLQKFQNVTVKLEVLEEQTKTEMNSLNASQIETQEKIATTEAGLKSLQTDSIKVSVKIDRLTNETEKIYETSEENIEKIFVQNEEIHRITTLYNKSLEAIAEENRLLKLELNQLETETRNNNYAMDSKVAQLEDKVELIDDEIDTVSKMQGPRGFNGSRGPPGAGDLSQCGHDTRSGGAAAVSRVTTTWYPQQEDEGRIIMGLYCSHNYETPAGTYLETRENGGVTQYRCVCGPMTNPPENTHNCKLHIWYCPETS